MCWLKPIVRASKPKPTRCWRKSRNFIPTITTSTVRKELKRLVRQDMAPTGASNPLIMAVERGSRARVVHSWAASLAFRGVIFLLALSSWGQSTKRMEGRPEPVFATRLRECVMRGIKLCKGCHLVIYQNFSRTEMGNSTSLPNRLLDLGWLSNWLIFSKEEHNRHYQVFARDGKVYQSEYGLDDKGKETFRHTEELALRGGNWRQRRDSDCATGVIIYFRRRFLITRPEKPGISRPTMKSAISGSAFRLRQTALAATPAGHSLFRGEKKTGCTAILPYLNWRSGARTVMVPASCT